MPIIRVDTIIPSQLGQPGEYLRTDGTTLSWEPADALPTQSGQSGEFLTTDGTDASWSTIVHPEELPSQSGQADKFLTTDGTNVNWETVSGAEISELNNFFKNWNVIDTTITTTVSASENAGVVGPISIVTGNTWSIGGGTVKIL